jgi:hypothetical protein
VQSKGDLKVAVFGTKSYYQRSLEVLPEQVVACRSIKRTICGVGPARALAVPHYL